jgi:hypothetical protein
MFILDSRVTEIFLRFEADLNFSRPSFSEIKVQIKWLISCPLDSNVLRCRGKIVIIRIQAT